MVMPSSTMIRVSLWLFHSLFHSPSSSIASSDRGGPVVAERLTDKEEQGPFYIPIVIKGSKCLSPFHLSGAASYGLLGWSGDRKTSSGRGRVGFSLGQREARTLKRRPSNGKGDKTAACSFCLQKDR